MHRSHILDAVNLSAIGVGARAMQCSTAQWEEPGSGTSHPWFAPCLFWASGVASEKGQAISLEAIGSE